MWNRPTQSQPVGRRTGEPLLHASPLPDVPKERQWHTEMRLEPLRSTAAKSCFLWLMWPAINWISMFWIGGKRYLLAPLCSLSWSCQLAFFVTHHGRLQWRLYTWWRGHVGKTESSTVGVSKAGVHWKNWDIGDSSKHFEIIGPSKGWPRKILYLSADICV